MDRKRLPVVIGCLVLALVATLLVFRAASVQSASLRRTVDVVRVVQYVPPGEVVREGHVRAEKVSEAAGKDYALTPDQVVGRVARAGLVEGQLVHPNALGGEGLRPGMVEVDVPVDLTSSCMVTAGDVVDVFAVSKDAAKDAPAQLLLGGVRVMHSYRSDGREVSPVGGAQDRGAVDPGGDVPASVGLEVPKSAAPVLVQVASQKRVYLAKAGPAAP